MAILKVNNLYKSFGKLDVIKDISFSVKKGEVLAIIGPSGSENQLFFAVSISLKELIKGKLKFAAIE